MILTTVKEQSVNMNEVVTRQILADEFTKFENRFEIKMERMIDLKIDQKFEEKFAEQEEKFDQLARNLEALIEDQNHKIQMTAESIMMHIEASERRWQEQGGLYGFLEKRVTRLESEVLIN